MAVTPLPEGHSKTKAQTGEDPPTAEEEVTLVDVGSNSVQGHQLSTTVPNHHHDGQEPQRLGSTLSGQGSTGQVEQGEVEIQHQLAGTKGSEAGPTGLPAGAEPLPCVNSNGQCDHKGSNKSHGGHQVQDVFKEAAVLMKVEHLKGATNLKADWLSWTDLDPRDGN